MFETTVSLRLTAQSSHSGWGAMAFNDVHNFGVLLCMSSSRLMMLTAVPDCYHHCSGGAVRDPPQCPAGTYQISCVVIRLYMLQFSQGKVQHMPDFTSSDTGFSKVRVL